MHITDRNKGINKEMNYTLYRYSVILDKPNMYCTHNTSWKKSSHTSYIQCMAKLYIQNEHTKCIFIKIPIVFNLEEY